jgi:hypothetical protein
LFIKLYFRISNDNQSMSWSCMILSILVIGLQLQLDFISNRWPYCTHYSTAFNVLVYYVNIGIKIYFSFQGNSTKTQKDKATRGKQPLHILKISIYNWLNTKTIKLSMHRWLNTKIIKLSMFSWLNTNIVKISMYGWINTKIIKLSMYTIVD